ncbi:hypothetical protein BOTCAL_0002g00090 [Botryotinia calthae]|uniref:Uncharacterized protein n=1 Tax=Botryotinia calthae TaxID=38488 RepID=A0A4Y8DHL7_9HELO|nr:hypothetical protein BOTCAL_0002g00090 [Botryotinia calthae]
MGKTQHSDPNEVVDDGVSAMCGVYAVCNNLFGLDLTGHDATAAGGGGDDHDDDDGGGGGDDDGDDEAVQ